MPQRPGIAVDLIKASWFQFPYRKAVQRLKDMLLFQHCFFLFLKREALKGTGGKATSKTGFQVLDIDQIFKGSSRDAADLKTLEKLRKRVSNSRNRFSGP